MPDPTLPFVTRLWFAWVCLFRVLFDGSFAERVFRLRAGEALPGAPEPEQLPAGEPEPRREPESEPPAAREVPAVAITRPPTDAALQLLTILQREGRLVDFLQQEIQSFTDADIGAAARVVHEGCRKALLAHVTVVPVRSEGEGSRVTLPAGFDAAAVKLTGNVAGAGPFTGVLRHRGWRAEAISLPALVGQHDVRVLAPAEVEL